MPQDVYYFVVWRSRRFSDASRERNTILKNIHPVLWAAQPAESYRKAGFQTDLLFWAEIPEAVATVPGVKGYFNIEDELPT